MTSTTGALMGVSEARTRLLSFFAPLDLEQVPLAEARGRILAQDIQAGIDLPPFPNSAMDGFALRSADLTGASPGSPVRLAVIEDIPAGVIPHKTLGAMQAARIMTGAVLPAGADCVVPVEDTDFQNRTPGLAPPQQVAVYQAQGAGSHVRPRGQDIRLGERVMSSGLRLRPQDLGMLAMLGTTQVPVHRRPRVAVFSSGDEILPLEDPLEPGKIHDSNSYTLCAAVEEAGALALNLGIVPDQAEAVRDCLDRAVAAQVDLILSSAGVSVGAFDFVRSVVEDRGRLDFWRVNMRPGKPLAFGEYQGIPFVGLPGNPVSAYIGFEVFVRPALAKLSGSSADSRPRERVILGEPVSSDGRESYLRAVVRFEGGQRVATLTGHQGSGNLLSLVQANAILIIPAGATELAPGAVLDAWLWAS